MPRINTLAYWVHLLKKGSVLKRLQGQYPQHFVFFVTYEMPQKATALNTLGWKGMPRINTLALWGSFVKKEVS
jgi:hypothetical protein